MKGRFLAWMLGFTAIVPFGALQADSPVPFELERLTLPASVTIEPVRTTELLQGNRSTIAFDGQTLPSHTIDTRVTRTLTGLWQMYVDPARAPAAALQVTYDLRGANGERNSLSMPGRNRAAIPVRIQSLAPRTIRTLAGTTTLEGDVVLHLDLDQVRLAGDYQGTLFISLNRL